MFINLKDVTQADFKSFRDIPVLDCHTHVWSVEEISRVYENEKRFLVGKINVLSITSYAEKCMANNAMCLLFKLMHPGEIYAFGSLQYPLTGAPDNGGVFLEQVQRLMKLGFDGMKMMEGKPNTRKRIGIALDSPIYDLYYRYLEENKIPLLFHVNDPKLHWDREWVEKSDLDRDWAYLDDSFQTKEDLYAEVEGVLKKFPRLRIIFAHFYFMDEEGIRRASDFLDRWPEVSFDLTPGRMFVSFEKDYEQWRDFFIKYQDRLMFGTDNDYGLSKELIHTVRTILETDNSTELWDTVLRGMHFDVDMLKKIYSLNFQKYAGTTPKKADRMLLSEECERLAVLAQSSTLKDDIMKDIKDVQAALTRIIL